MTNSIYFFDLLDTDKDSICSFKVSPEYFSDGTIGIDCSNSTILVGSKTTKIKKESIEYGIIATALQQLVKDNDLLRSKNLFKIEISFSAFAVGELVSIPVEPHHLSQRFITVTNKNQDTVLDVRYFTTHGDFDEIYPEGSFVVNLVNKVFDTKQEILATKVLAKLHSKTKDGDYLSYNTSSKIATVNVVSNLASTEAAIPTRNTPIEILTSRELTNDELNVLLKTYTEHDNISLVVEIYDSINRFVLVDPKKTAEKSQVREVMFKKKDRDYKATITAAHIAKFNNDGEKIDEYDIFPGRVEMMVEYAIRQLFEKKRPIARGAIIGVEFTIYELEAVLKNSFGKTYSHSDIRNAIEVLHKSNITIESTSNNKGDRYTSEGSSYLPYLSWGDENKRSFVSLHSALMLEVGRVSYRGMSNFSIKYSKQYTQSNVIEKLLYLHWVNASDSNPYTIKMSTLLINAGLISENTKNNWKIVQKAIADLSNDKDGMAIIKPNPDIEIRKEGKKIIERLITFYPTESFIAEQKKISKLKSEAVHKAADLVASNNSN